MEKLPRSVLNAMLADLKKSGLSAKDAEALGLEHDDSAERPCYAIPYFDLDGKATQHYRIRFLGKPEELELDAKGRPIRYTQPKGSAPRFYLPKLVAWKKLAGDASSPLWITEGEKKSAALCKLGFPTIGLGGVWNWRTSENGGHAIDDFNRFAWKGRRVAVVFDSDAKHKTDVQRALRALADELIKRGAIPCAVDLPQLRGTDKTGADDFIEHHGNGEKARKLFAALPCTPLLIPQGISFEEIATKKLPEPKWVVPGLLPVGLSELAGKPKIGKSWLTLDLSIAVASGGKVLGTYEAKRGAVLHLALEDTQRRFQDRLRRVLDGTPPPSGGQFFAQWPCVERHGHEALRRALDTTKDVRLVIVDTLAKMRTRPSGNGGSLYSEDYEALGQLKSIADEYGVGLLVVHHTRKQTSDDPVDSPSGSTGNTGAIDTLLVLRRERGEADASLFITGRDIEEQEIALQMDKRTMRWKALGRAEDYRLSIERKEVIDALKELGHAAAPHEVSELIGKTRGATKVLMLRMVNAGQLWKTPEGQYELKEKKGG